MQDRVSMIRQRLTTALAPTQLDIDDQSHLHAGHAGARAGGGHFAVMIVSEQFNNKTLIQRHRLVYQALADEMKTEIHALSIKALTPEEHQA